MIFGLHRQPLVLRIERRPLGHRPGQQHAVPFEPEVVVQVRGEVLLHAEEELVALLRFVGGASPLGSGVLVKSRFLR